jgi:hypothetical protein
MDAYHQVLVKLLEETQGREGKAVDFKDLVKKVGFHGNYPNIFNRLSEEGWIAEDMKADFVRITHWGVAEAKKAKAQADGVPSPTSERATKCVPLAREFITALEKYARDASKDNLKIAAEKFQEMELAFNLAKNDAK